MSSLQPSQADPQTDDGFQPGWFALLEYGGDGRLAKEAVEQVLRFSDLMVVAQMRDKDHRKALDVATLNVKRMLQQRYAQPTLGSEFTCATHLQIIFHGALRL